MYTYDLHFEIFVIIVVFITFLKIVALKLKNELVFTNVVLGISQVIYSLLLVKTAVLPITVGAEEFLGIDFEIKQGIQITPCATIVKAIRYGNWIQIIGNIILLIPLPIFISISKENISRKVLLVIAVCSSISIEILQLVLNIASRYNNHVADIDDVILNVIGAGVVILFIHPICDILKRLLK